MSAVPAGRRRDRGWAASVTGDWGHVTARRRPIVCGRRVPRGTAAIHPGVLSGAREEIRLDPRRERTARGASM